MAKHYMQTYRRGGVFRRVCAYRMAALQ